MTLRGEEYRQLQLQLTERVMQTADVSRELSDKELLEVIEQVIRDCWQKRYLSIELRRQLKREIFNSLRRLDVLQELLEDPAISEIMVNGAERNFVEREGRL